MLKSRIFALSFRIAFFLLCVAGILAQIGVFSGSINLTNFLYYTLQSNILVLVLIGVLIYKTAVGLKREGKNGSSSYFERTSAAVLIYILKQFAFCEVQFLFMYFGNAVPDLQAYKIDLRKLTGY